MTEVNSLQMLRQTLLDSRNLALCCFDDLDENTDLSPMDLGIRHGFVDGDALYQPILKIALGLSFGTILILRDRLRLTTLLFRGPQESNRLYTIGPFRSLPYQEEDYAIIQQQSGMTASNSEFMKLVLRPVPCNILRTEAIAVARNILLFFHGLQEPTVEEYTLEKSGEMLPSIIPVEDISLRIKQVERTYQFEELLIDAISSGDENRAMEFVHYFMNHQVDKRAEQPLQSHRSLMYASNTLFRKAAQTRGIHPVFLDEISRGFAQKFSACATREQLDAVYLEMIHEYCLLCQERATGNYSPNIKKIIHYIQLNFSEDISPDSVAEAVSFSPSYVSRRFKEEVGMSLMSYVTQCRIQKAQSLLEKTTLTVREIANYVGIPDWNYFTKIFKKELGCTPSEYRHKLPGDEK